jgi:hypothetical protein
MKSTIVFFVVLIFASFALRDFNAQEGYTKLAVVVNTTFMLSVIYIVSMISVKDIQKMMKKQIKKDCLEGRV